MGTLFAINQPRPRLYTNKEVSQLTGLSGSRLREYQRARWIAVREVRRSGEMRTNLISAVDCAAFCILSELYDAVECSPQVMGMASLACYTWVQPMQVQQKDLPGHPVAYALRDIARAPKDWWMLRVRSLKHTQTGQREIQAFLFSQIDPPKIVSDPADGWAPSVDIHLLVNPVLLPLVRRLREHAGVAARLDA